MDDVATFNGIYTPTLITSEIISSGNDDTIEFKSNIVKINGILKAQDVIINEKKDIIDCIYRQILRSKVELENSSPYSSILTRISSGKYCLMVNLNESTYLGILHFIISGEKISITNKNEYNHTYIKSIKLVDKNGMTNLNKDHLKIKFTKVGNYKLRLVKIADIEVLALLGLQMDYDQGTIKSLFSRIF